MMSTLGSTLVLLALAAAAFGGVVGLIAPLTGREAGHKVVRGATWLFSLAMIAANLTMVGALLAHDFSIKYVAQVGSRATPTLYTIVSLWSALEGSILFWGAILGVFLIAFLLLNRHKDQSFVTLALGVMLLVGAFFGFLIAGPANPFLPTPLPIPLDGPGPNPQLQNHVLMIVHPPMLYLGYVGMTVPFGIATAGLIAGKLSNDWMPALRRWTLVPWMFLSLGIVFGSWWAYAVLGWGGYWAWDPVENASLLPWLTAAAFIHATLVQERRKMLRLWTVALVLLSFWLTIMGTFMTRSGIFNSVHAFTQSNIGPTFLVFLGVLALVSVGLLTVRGPILAAEEKIRSPLSRESAVLAFNLVLTALTFTVFLGTCFPLVVEALEGKRISVGEPYFNRFAVPLGLAILFLMGVGPSLPWGATQPRQAMKRLALPTGAALLTLVVALLLGAHGVMPLVSFALAGFAVAVTVREMFLPAMVRVRERHESALDALSQSIARGNRRFGGHLVHLGVVAMIVGVTGSAAFPTAVSGTVKEGETFQVGKYTLKYTGMTTGREPHRTFVGAAMEIVGGAEGVLTPRMNYYDRSNDPIGTPAVRTTATDDLYVSLMTHDEEKHTATYRAWVFPLVGWIWWSLPFFVFGTVIAIWPAGKKKEEPAVAAMGQATPAAGGAP